MCYIWWDFLVVLKCVCVYVFVPLPLPCGRDSCWLWGRRSRRTSMSLQVNVAFAFIAVNYLHWVGSWMLPFSVNFVNISCLTVDVAWAVPWSPYWICQKISLKIPKPPQTLQLLRVPNDEHGLKWFWQVQRIPLALHKYCFWDPAIRT